MLAVYETLSCDFADILVLFKIIYNPRVTKMMTGFSRCTCLESHSFTKSIRFQADCLYPCKDIERAPLVERNVADSVVEASHDMRNEYARFDGGVCLEKILPDMVALAGNVAQIHSDNNDNYPISFVTASVDRLDMLQHLQMNRLWW